MNVFLRSRLPALIIILLLAGHFACNYPNKQETPSEDNRMEWWREARFGLFIHWGLYSIPAGEWNGETSYGEWIRTSAQIPLEVYDQFVGQFNPTRFNASEWVRMAKAAGMKYIVITSKHHDGFCLFDSEYTDFDVMSTPFQRDILKELSQACKDEGIRLCFYHSIMDWHHPDYLPRRDWEAGRSADGADFERYIRHMKTQLKELVDNYGPLGILWFDGEWESTWDHAYGKDLYEYVRELQADIIINNRVDVGRSGMAGLTKKWEYAGDYGTPEQEVPATGLAGIDWETCMTMNDHWGFNKHDTNWKSSAELIRMLTDIASKGGNFLLNVGPTAEGVFPQASIDRLKDIGNWMDINREAIYGTQASPFRSLSWGRCTVKPAGKRTRLYLHVFEWPENGELTVPGLFNRPQKAYFLADESKSSLPVNREGDALVIGVPLDCPDTANTVVVLEIQGEPDINDPPEILAETGIFIDNLQVELKSDRKEVEIRFTLDGSEPVITSTLYSGPIILHQSATVNARCFRKNRPVSGTSSHLFSRVEPMASTMLTPSGSGLTYAFYEGNWDSIPDFSSMKPSYEGTRSNFLDIEGNGTEFYALSFTGHIRIPETGVYRLYIDSDDGSRLFIDGNIVADNDGLHGLTEKEGVVALSEGFHTINVHFFEKTGGDELRVSIEGPGMIKQAIPDSLLYH